MSKPTRKCSRLGRTGAARGVILLEVILSLALFVLAVGVMGSGLSSSARACNRLRVEAQAADKAVTVSSELQMGLLDLVNQGPVTEDAEPDWSWQVAAESQLNVPGMMQVRIVVTHLPTGQAYHLTQWLPGSPKDTTDANADALDEPADSEDVEPVGEGSLP